MAVNDAATKHGSDPSEDPSEDDLDDAERPPMSAPNTLPNRRRRRLPFAVAGGAVLVAAAVTAVLLASRGSTTKSSPPPTPGFVPFVDQSAHFSLSYPSDWLVGKSNDPNVPLLLSFGADGLDTLLVRAVAIQGAVDTSNVSSIKAFTDAVISGTRVTVLKQSPITVNGTPGYYYLYTLPPDPASGVTLVHSHLFVFPHQEMVSLLFQTVDHDFTPLASTFDQVVNSLRAT